MQQASQYGMISIILPDSEEANSTHMTGWMDKIHRLSDCGPKAEFQKVNMWTSEQKGMTGLKDDWPCDVTEYRSAPHSPVPVITR